MVYRPHVDQKLCFVIMPFERPFDGYYKEIIQPAVGELGLGSIRSDEIYDTRAIIQDIWERIWRASVVVADVTDKNPNVNYELGLCHALDVPTVIMSKRVEDIPFDYRHKRCIIYKTDEAGWEDKLRGDLKRTILKILNDDQPPPELSWPYDTYLLAEPSTVTALITSEAPYKIVLRGARIVSDAARAAFGPHGTYISASSGFEIARPYFRGFEIARTLRSANVLEERGIEQMRLIAMEVFARAGDGTKGAIILAQGLLEHGYEAISQGHTVRDVVRGMELAINTAIGTLESAAKSTEAKDLLPVASTAAGSDHRVGSLVIEGFKKIGRNGVMTVMESDDPGTSLEIQEGLHFDSGYLSKYFTTDINKLECVLENCLVLVYDGKISSMKDLLPLLEDAARQDRSILVIADGVEGEALATLVVNQQRGSIKCAAVKAPAHGDRRLAILEDIAVVTGGKAISTEFGPALQNVRLDKLGTAKKVVVTEHDTTIIGGSGSQSSIEKRVEAIRSQIEHTENGFDKEKLQERLATLAGSVATMRIGGLTKLDVFREKYKVESAMHSTRNAMEEGWLPGGGVALLRAGDELNQVTMGNDTENATRTAVSRSLEIPLLQLIENAKRSPTQLLSEIRGFSKSTVGFNAESGKVEDMVEAGIVDPARTLRVALLIAWSHVKAVLQTGSWELSGPTEIDGIPQQSPLR